MQKRAWNDKEVLEQFEILPLHQLDHDLCMQILSIIESTGSNATIYAMLESSGPVVIIFHKGDEPSRNVLIPKLRECLIEFYRGEK